jgi:hypothetical protein
MAATDARVRARRQRRCSVVGDSARRRGSEKIGGGGVCSGDEDSVRRR